MFEEFSDVRLPKAVQARRVARVMRGESQKQIALDRGVSAATVCRTYKRGIDRLKRFLRY